MRLYLIEIKNGRGTLETYAGQGPRLWDLTNPLHLEINNGVSTGMMGRADLVFWYDGVKFHLLKDRYGDFYEVAKQLKPKHLTALSLEIIPKPIMEYLTGSTVEWKDILHKNLLVDDPLIKG